MNSAPRYLQRETGITSVNLGPGNGLSVLELITAFEKTTGLSIPYELIPRRSSDVASCYTDPSKAEALFGWRSQRTLKEMCVDTWNWQSKNPDGYKGRRFPESLTRKFIQHNNTLPTWA